MITMLQVRDKEIEKIFIESTIDLIGVQLST